MTCAAICLQKSVLYFVYIPSRFYSTLFKDMEFLVYLSWIRYRETLNDEYIERIHQMSYSSLSVNGMMQLFSFLIKWLFGTLQNCSRIFMDIYLFSQILKFTKYSIKLIEELSRRQLINSSDVFLIKGFTVGSLHFTNQSPKLKTKYRNETQYRKPSFIYGVSQFCRYKYFC